MSTTRAHAFLLLLASLALVAVIGTGAQAQSTTADASDPGAAETAPAAESDGDRERFQSLLAERDEARRVAAELDRDARSAVGEDKVALHSQSIAVRVAEAGKIADLTALLEHFEEAGEDTKAERKALRALLQGVSGPLRAVYDQQLAELGRLKAEASELPNAEVTATRRPAIERHERLLLQILDEGIDALELSDKLGLATGDLRNWLTEQVEGRARLAASHMALALQRLSDLSVRGAAGDDPAVLGPSEMAAKQRLDSSSAALEQAVAMMERLELDVARYRAHLLASTGDLTIDSIDRQVAGDLLARWADDLEEGFAANAPRVLFQALVVAILLTAFWWLSRAVRRVVGRALEAPHLGLSQLLKRMITSLSTGAVLLLGLLLALSQVGIEVGPMLTGLGIAGFIVGFALQDTLGNFAAGVLILLYRPYDVGDMIDCAGGVFGEVSHMSLVSTTILTIDNKTLIVPNSKIWGDVITNVTAQSIRRVDLEFGIGYADDIPKAEEILRSVLVDHPKILEHPEPMVKLHSLGDSSVNFVVRPWVRRDDYWDVWWDVTREVKMRFDREGVSIPFPQRDVHVYAEAEPPPQGATVAPMEISSSPPGTLPDAED